MNEASIPGRGRNWEKYWIALHHRTILRDDFLEGHPRLALNIPAGEKVEKLTQEELEWLYWLREPRPFSEAMGRYDSFSGGRADEARTDLHERFVDKELVALHPDPHDFRQLSRQDHLRIAPPGGSVFSPMRTPNHVYLELTQACNLRCVHCFSEEGGRSAFLSRADIENLFRQMDELGVTAVTLSGGEPTLHPDFAPIFEKAVSSRMGMTLLTNATLLKDRGLLDLVLEAAGRHKAFTLGVSFDAVSDDLHDRIRGVPGSLRRTREALEYLTRHGFFNISVQFMLCKHNIHEVEAVTEWAVDHGIRRVILFDILQLGRGRDCRDLLPDSTQEQWLTAKSFDLLARYGDKVEIRLSHKIRHLVDLLNDTTGPCRERPTCLAGMEEFAVRADGSVHPCSYIWADEFLLGNIHESSLLSLWGSERMNFFRGGYSVPELRGCSLCEYRTRYHLKECRALPIMADDKYGPYHNCLKFEPMVI